MTLHRFIDYLKVNLLAEKQLEDFLSDPSVRDLVFEPIGSDVAERYGYEGSERENIIKNIKEIDHLIENGTVYFLQYKKQSLSDLFAFGGHNRKEVDPIMEVSANGSIY